MKKIFLMATGILLSATLFAQSATFGIKAGVQSSSLRMKIEEDDTKAIVDGTRPGFLIGGVADIKFSENWSVQPNLLFAMKNGVLLLGTGKTQLFTIDVPLNLLYHHGGFFAGAGPNFSYGISGKLKPFDSGDDDTDLYKGEGGSEAPFKRFEFGINALLGYEFPGGFTLSANYTPGMTDILNESSEGIKINTSMFGINFGYNFKKGKK